MGANITEITKENFESEVLKSSKPVVIDLWAEWCMPCKMIAPTIDELSNEYSGKVSMAKINVDDAPELATELSVMSIPTLIFFKNGGEVGRMVGVNPKENIKQKIEDMFD